MIQQGLLMYINAGLAALTPSIVLPGGFPDILQPTDLISPAVPQAWAFRDIVAPIDYNLQGPGWIEWQVEIACHGVTALLRDQLSRAIEAILDPGFSGKFPDPDQTLVAGIYRLPFSGLSGFSDANHSYVRSLEYAVLFQQ